MKAKRVTVSTSLYMLLDCLESLCPSSKEWVNVRIKTLNEQVSEHKWHVGPPESCSLSCQQDHEDGVLLSLGSCLWEEREWTSEQKPSLNGSVLVLWPSTISPVLKEFLETGNFHHIYHYLSGALFLGQDKLTETWLANIK